MSGCGQTFVVIRWLVRSLPIGVERVSLRTKH